MVQQRLFLDNGSEEINTTIESAAGAIPVAMYLASPETESIGELAARAYGANTKAHRDMLRKANVSLNGIVRIPTS